MNWNVSTRKWNFFRFFFDFCVDNVSQWLPDTNHIECAADLIDCIAICRMKFTSIETSSLCILRSSLIALQISLNIFLGHFSRRRIASESNWRRSDYRDVRLLTAIGSSKSPELNPYKSTLCMNGIDDFFPLFDLKIEKTRYKALFRSFDRLPMLTCSSV